jgi:cytochrome P450
LTNADDVIVTNSNAFHKSKLMTAPLARVVGDSILVTEGAEHKHHRKALEPAFAFRHLKSLYPVFWSKACESVNAIGSQMYLHSTPADGAAESAPTKDMKTVFDVDAFASRVALDVIGAAGLGRDFGAIKDPEIPLAKVLNEVFEPKKHALIVDLFYMLFLGPIISLLPGERNNVIAQASRTIKETCHDIVREKRAGPKGEKGLNAGRLPDCDITSALMRDPSLEDDAVVEQMRSFLAAGLKGPASSFTWAVYLLCQNPEIQSNLRAEIRANLPSPSDQARTVEAADIDDLPYLTAVCLEVLRFMPPAPFTLREAVENTAIAGEHVPKGTSVLISMWAVNRSVSLWGTDAGQFNPNRWLTTVTHPETGHNSFKVNKSGGAVSNYAFMTFWHGRGNCIGQNFAMAEMACVIASWVGRFEFALSDMGDACSLQINKGGPIMCPRNGLYVEATVIEGW